MKPWIFDSHVPLLGQVSIPGYYFWLAVAYIVSAFVVTREARRAGVPIKVVLDLALIVLIGSLVGARLGWILTVKPGVYLQDPLRIFQVWRGGFVFYGGLLFNTLCMWAYIRWRRLDFWRLADVYAPALGMGVCLGRMACYSAGCCYGRPATWPLGVALPWGITFERGPMPAALEGIPLHPTQLYQSLLGLILFLVAMWVVRHKRYDGQAFLVVVIGYSVGRSLVEIFRSDLERGVYWGFLSTSQLISIPLVIGALVGMAVLSRRAAAAREA